MKVHPLAILLAVVLCLLPATAPTAAPAGDTPGYRDVRDRTLHIALVPEKNVFEQKRRYSYITEYLASRLGFAVEIDLMTSYGEICENFANDQEEAGFFGSYSYTLTHAKVPLEPLARPLLLDGHSTYRGYLFVRRDSNIKTVADMRGKTLALVDKATTAGYIFPRFFFKNHGIAALNDHFSRIVYAGSHDAAAWAVYIGEAQVGAAKNHVFRDLCAEHPDFEKEMLVLAESPDVPSNAFSVRADLNPALKLRLQSLLLTMHENPEGAEALHRFGASRFVATTDADYESLYRMVRELAIDLKTTPCSE